MKTKSGEQTATGKLIIWAIAVAITLMVFYGMNHFVMSIQGLPLNWDMTPTQQR